MQEELNMDSVSVNSDEVARLNATDIKNENAINNVALMKTILDKMNKELLTPFKKKKQKMAWSERLIVVSDNKEEVKSNIDVNNDVQRELQFYNIALGNIKVGMERVAAEGLKLDRPQDFLAEMFKTDQMMTKIRSSLVQAQVKVRNYEEQQMKKHAKKIQKSRKHQKNLEASQKSKDSKVAIHKWKGDIKQKGSGIVKDLDDYIKKETDKRTQKKGFQNIKSKGVKKTFNRLGKEARTQNFKRKLNTGNKKKPTFKRK